MWKFHCKLSSFFLAAASIALAQAPPLTPIYPGAIPVNSDFALGANFAQTTLASNVNNSTLSIPLTDASGFTVSGIVRIETEFIRYCSKTVNTLNVCSGGRGQDQANGGSAPAAHNALTTVRDVVMAYHHNRLVAEVLSVLTELGTDLQNVDDYSTIQDEGSGLTERRILNFIGAGINCVDNSGNTRTDCTIDVGALTVEEADGAPTISSVTTIQFDQADGFTVTDETGGQVQIDLVNAPDAAISDAITLTNITQVTTRAHASLQTLGADDHSQYALLLGRATGQVLIGGTGAGDDLTLQTTSNVSKGSYIFSELTSAGFLRNTAGGVVTGGNAASGVGACVANNAATTLNNNAAPSCTEFTALGQEIALTTETSGNYVATVADGTGIDGTATGEGSTYTPTLDLTEINSTTFGDNSIATVTHTVDPTGATNPVWSYSNGTVNLSTGNLQEGGVDVLTALPAHASTHQDSGSDEVATATPAANAIPKAGSGGDLAEGWIPTTLDQTYNFTSATTNDVKNLNSELLSTQFDWSQSPPESVAVGATTLTLTPCPVGINGTNTFHELFVNDTDDSPPDETVTITGGTCTSGASSGTVQFTGAAIHTNGTYTLESATAGIQEALWALADLSGVEGGVVNVPVGTHTLEGTLSIGDGSQTPTSQGTASTQQFIRVIGQGLSETTASPADNATELVWAGPAGDPVVFIRGNIEGCELSHMRITGEGTSGDIIRAYGLDRCRLEYLNLYNSSANDAALQLSNIDQSVLARINVVQLASGSSGLRLGDGSTLISSQSFFSSISINGWGDDLAAGDGIYIEGADNNTFLQIMAVSQGLVITDCTNASPIVVTTTSAHGRTAGDSIRILTVLGNTACNGEFVMTDLTATTFELDGSSGNGAYSSGGKLHGPGASLEFKRVGATTFPLENTFIASAFIGPSMISDGLHGPNLFLGLSSGDVGDDPTNSTTNAGQFVGFAHPPYGTEPTDRYMRFLGDWAFMDDDSITPFARFDDDTNQVAFGNVDEFSDAIGRELTIRQIGSDAELIIRTVTSGDAVLELSADGNANYIIIADRAGNKFRIFQGGGGGVKDFLEFLPSSETTRIRGDIVEFYSNTSSPTLRVTIQDTGEIELAELAADPVCSAAEYSFFGNSTRKSLTKCEDGEVTPFGIPSSSVVAISEEFLGRSVADNSIGTHGWSRNLGSSGILSSLAVNADHPQAIRLDTGTTTNSTITLYLSSASGSVIDGDKDFDLMMVVRTITIDSNTQIRIGLGATTTGDPPNDAIYFEKLAADTNWFAVNRVASSENRVDTTVAVATGWHTFRIRRTSGSNIAFVIDGGSDINNGSNIPTVLLSPMAQNKTTTTAAKQLDIDYYAFSFPVTR